MTHSWYNREMKCQMENNFDGADILKGLEEMVLLELRDKIVEANSRNLPAFSKATITLTVNVPALIVRMAAEELKREEST
jgi:hypothetical protein